MWDQLDKCIPIRREHDGKQNITHMHVLYSTRWGYLGSMAFGTIPQSYMSEERHHQVQCPVA